MDASSFQIATPCQVPWSQMKGDDRVRRCDQCKLDVTNIESLTTAEAEDVLKRVACGGRVCVRYYRRFDGTVLTKDCEGGLRSAWREAKRRRRESNGLAAFGYFGVVVVTAWLVALLLGDNIRRAFGQSAGTLAGSESVPRGKRETGFISPPNTY